MKRITYFLLPALILSLFGCSSSGAPSAPAASSSAQETEQAETPAEEEETAEPEAEEPEEEPEAEETAEAEQTPEAEAEEPEIIPVTGTYILYSIDYSGQTYKPEDMMVSCEITLNEDGSGALTMNGSENKLPKWEEADGKVTLYNENGDPLECELQDGILSIEMNEGYYWYLAHEATGLAGSDTEKMTGSMVYAVYEKIDLKEGVHLSYEFHSDYMDSTSVFDVHAKDEVFYSEQTVKVSGTEQLKATFFKDGTMYVLYPDEMKGNVATTSDTVASNVLLLDDLYYDIYTMAHRSNYTVETREVDGTEYTVEVFPATIMDPETALYFDEDGKLVHILEGAPAANPDLGETFFTVHSIDTDVNDSLFDISGYEITE